MQGMAKRRSTARADDEGHLARQRVMLGIRGRSEDAVIGRGDPRLTHEVLGEDLAPFQLGRLLARSEDAQALALEDVDDPLGERLLRADDRQADTLALGELDQAPGIPRLDGHVMHVQGGPRVPGGAEGRRGPARLLEFPAKSVLTPSLADD